MPNSSSSSSSHCIVWMLNSIVREAFVTSVTKARPSVSFQISQESIVPASSRPDSAFSRAPGTLSRIQRSFVAEKYASTSRPVLARIFSTSASSCRSASHASAVRRHCHTMALHTGRPVSRSHATNRFALVRDADGGDLRASQVQPRERLHEDAELRDVDIRGVVLHPAGPRVNLRELPLRDRDDILLAVEHDAPAARGAFIERDDVFFLHGGCASFPENFSPSYHAAGRRVKKKAEKAHNLSNAFIRFMVDLPFPPRVPPLSLQIAKSWL